MNTLGLYIHVPFCGKKCRYCDFYSVSYTKANSDAYTNAVLRNIKHYSDKTAVLDTIYFGGGTPSLLSAEQISRFITDIKASFKLSADAEITLEANPNTLTYEKLAKLCEIGINRLSVGIQSMIDDELKLLGRTHTAERAVRCVYDAEKAGFSNISCDLMIALPEQTSEKLRFSIDAMAELPIQHISAYMLKIEKGTPFDCKEMRNALPNDDAAAELYMTAAKKLRKHGFLQYEVSNFAKTGFESRHNCRYWKCLDYIGIGPSAHSCYNGKRFAAVSDAAAFIASPVQQTKITDSSPCGYEEFSMLRLRLAEGLYLKDIEPHRSAIEKKIPPLVKAGYVKYDGERVSLTPKGFLMSNSVIEYLIF